MNTGKQLVSKPSFDLSFGVGFTAGYEAGFAAAMKLFGSYLPPAPEMVAARPAPKPRLDGAAFADVMYKATTVTDAQREEAQALAEIRAARRRASKGHIDPKAKAEIEKLQAAGYVTDPQCPSSLPNPVPIACPETPPPTPKEETPPLTPPLTKGGERGEKFVSRKSSAIEKNSPGGVSKAFDPDGKGRILIIPPGDPACFEIVQATRFKEAEAEDLEARTQQAIDNANQELRQRYEARKAERKQKQKEKVAQ